LYNCYNSYIRKINILFFLKFTAYGILFWATSQQFANLFFKEGEKKLVFGLLVNTCQKKIKKQFEIAKYIEECLTIFTFKPKFG
jgi:hypothetical protein